MWRGFSTNLRTLLWAFALALAVWISAVTSSDPDQVRVYPSPIPVEIVGQDPSLVLTSTLPKQVEVTLRAPRSIWEKITAHPNSVRALLDLSGLEVGQHTLDFQIQVTEWPVRIVSANPVAATFTLERLASQTLTVESVLTGELPAGFRAGEVVIKPEQVVVSGPESLVGQAERLRVVINLAGTRENIETSLPVQVLNGGNLAVSGLTLNPASVQVHLPVAQQGGYRDMAVKVVVRGQPASGYRLANITSFPPVVTVFSANPEQVNALPGYVETQALELNDAKADISTRLSLNLPTGISVVGAQEVLVQAGITAIQSSLTLSNKHIEVIGLDPALDAHIAPEAVDVILSGPLPLLDVLSAQDVRVIVDVTGSPAGTYQLTPQVEFLIADLQVESILPATVEVVLVPVVTPTPQP